MHLEFGHSNNPKEPYTKQRHVNKMFGSFLSKLDGEIFPWALDFGQSINTFYRISGFFKHNFCVAPRWKINCPGEFNFFIFPR